MQLSQGNTHASSSGWDQLFTGKLVTGILEDKLSGGQQGWPATPRAGSMNITSRLHKRFFFFLALVRQHGVQYHVQFCALQYQGKQSGVCDLRGEVKESGLVPP